MPVKPGVFPQFVPTRPALQRWKSRPLDGAFGPLRACTREVATFGTCIVAPCRSPRLTWSILSTLHLKSAPVAIAFLAAPPSGIPTGSTVPGRPGAATGRKPPEGRAFYTTAQDHTNCPVGAFTHGVELSPRRRRAAGARRHDDRAQVPEGRRNPADLPHRTEPMQVAAYAPLASTPSSPTWSSSAGMSRQIMLPLRGRPCGRRLRRRDRHGPSGVRDAPAGAAVGRRRPPAWDVSATASIPACRTMSSTSRSRSACWWLLQHLRTTLVANTELEKSTRGVPPRCRPDAPHLNLAGTPRHGL